MLQLRLNGTLSHNGKINLSFQTAFFQFIYVSFHEIYGVIWIFPVKYRKNVIEHGSADDAGDSQIEAAGFAVVDFIHGFVGLLFSTRNVRRH